MNIVIDIDNVVCDFVHAMVSYMNKKLGTSYRKTDITIWDFVDSPNVDIEYDTMMSLFVDFFNESLWHTAPLYPDAKDVLDWIAANHNFIYLTNRPPEAESSTYQYFKENNLPFTGLHVLQSYHDDIESGFIVFVNGHQKSVFANKIFADVAIDDKPQTIQEYLDDGIRSALKVEPYNEWVKYKDPKRLMARCESLTRFREWLEELERK